MAAEAGLEGADEMSEFDELGKCMGLRYHGHSVRVESVHASPYTVSSVPLRS